MENGYTKPTNAQDIVGFTQFQRYELKENWENDSKDLLFIQQAMHDIIFRRLFVTKKSKESWDVLQQDIRDI